ncbi:hypothetical protein P261_00432 [Lachnospiraceae bacterium TWA4]|nr:hypothetical protein P261_00432 [Lachnospiraceae bacterium TWA4]
MRIYLHDEQHGYGNAKAIDYIDTSMIETKAIVKDGELRFRFNARDVFTDEQIKEIIESLRWEKEPCNISDSCYLAVSCYGGMSLMFETLDGNEVEIEAIMDSQDFIDLLNGKGKCDFFHNMQELYNLREAERAEIRAMVM